MILKSLMTKIEKESIVMVIVNFLTNNQSVTVKKGTTILEAARKIGIIIESPCNSEGACGKCKVKVSQNNLTGIIDEGKHHLSDEEKAQGFVLSCQAKVIKDIDVEEIPENLNKNLQILTPEKKSSQEIYSIINRFLNQDK